MSQRRKPPLSDEEIALFRAAMEGVTRARRDDGPPPPRAQPPRPPALRQAQGERLRSVRAEPVEARTATADPRNMRRLKRGQIRPEAVLDLHGHTLARAHEALHRFIARAQGQGARCVIVITGKGATDAPTLRAEVPRWLNESGLRGLILGFSEARPQDGGAGALYVLLRRVRT